MRNAFAFVLRFCLVFLMLIVSQRSAVSSEPRLYINEIKVLENRVEIHYEINFGGYVEFHLMHYDSESYKEKTIWVKGEIREEIAEPQVFMISRKALNRYEKGERFSFILKYKGRDYTGSFYNEMPEEENEE